MRIRVPAPTLLSRVIVDQDLDMTGYKVVNAGNVDLQTDGVIINDLLLKRSNSNRLDLRDSGDTINKHLWLSRLIAEGDVVLGTSGQSLRTRNTDDTYVTMKARENTVGLAEIARLRGAATPTFDILAGRLTGDLECNNKVLRNRWVSVGDYLVASADTEDNEFNNTTPTKRKEIEIAVGGNYRIKFDLYSVTAGETVYGQVYKNGIGHGTQRSTTSDTYVTFSEDLGFVAGDLIQLYTWTDVDANVYWRNFRVYAQDVEVYIVNLDT